MNESSELVKTSASPVGNGWNAPAKVGGAVVDQNSVECAAFDGAGDWTMGTDPVLTARRGNSLYWIGKEVLDTIAAALLLIVLSPVFLLIALLIKLDSDGPVFFVQERVGWDPIRGRLTSFKMYKFRTMRYRADEAVHRAYVANLIKENAGPAGDGTSLKMANDPRITRVGRLLRKSSLDELPQLINVLKGDMSLVGPRPALPYEVEIYEDWHMRRLQALPGMTGWWQVKGRNQVTFEDMVCMDVYYIEHGSLGLDLRILLLTPLAIFAGKGAG